MTIKGIDPRKSLDKAKELLRAEKGLSPAFKSAMSVILTLLEILLIRFSITSKNSSKPPSDDKNRKRGSNRKKSGKSPGGQKGRIGKRLQKV